jgi:hypothetical protein
MTREQFNNYYQRGQITTMLYDFYNEKNINQKMSFGKEHFDMFLNSWIMSNGVPLQMGYSTLVDIVEKTIND